jgi:release factor glutamine methyltransferase
LDGGAGLGIDALVPICTGAVALLQPGGFLALETGGGEQAHYIADVLQRLRDVQQGDGSGEGRQAFGEVRVRRDLFGVDRFVTATRAMPGS